jgi:hypothetical protein
VVTGSAFVTIEDLTVISAGSRPAVDLTGTAAATVARITALVLGTRDLAVPAISLGGVAILTALRDNVIVAQLGIGGGGTDKAPLLAAELDVRDNVLVCRDVGIGLEGRVGHLLGNGVVANTVLRASQAGIRLLGAIAPGHGCTVADNTILVGGAGIQVGAGGFTVDGNAVAGSAQSLEIRGDGIAVLPSTFGALRGPTRVAGNRIRDVGGRGVAVLAPVSSLEVTHNLVERAMHGIVMDERARATAATVSDNTVTDVGSRETDQGDGVAGIRVVGCERATVESNTVHGVGAAREARGASTGIDVLACIESRVAGNSVDRVGFPEAGGRDLGIGVRGRVIRTQVSGNSSRRQPVDPDEDGPSAFQGLLVGSDGDPREPGVAVVKGFVMGTGPATFAIGTHAAFATPFVPASVTVDANIVAGSPAMPAALVGIAGEVVLTGNQLHSRRDTGTPALLLRALAATVSANRFRGGEPSAQLEVDPERLAVLGNLSSTVITVFGGGLDARWDPLNLNGV